MNTKRTVEALRAAEEALGGNLVWITDLADLHVRQGDPEAKRRLGQLNDAWRALCAVLKTLESAP